MTDIVFETTVLPDAFPGTPYKASIAISWAASVVTAGSLASGTLPPGLSIASDHVRITGTVSGVFAPLPKAYSFTLSLTDTAGAKTSGTYTITVREPQAVPGKGYADLPPVAQQAALWPESF